MIYTTRPGGPLFPCASPKPAGSGVTLGGRPVTVVVAPDDVEVAARYPQPNVDDLMDGKALRIPSDACTAQLQPSAI